MKIIALEAENLKRLTAVHIRPDGNLVQFTGKNGQGKTSGQHGRSGRLSNLDRAR